MILLGTVSEMHGFAEDRRREGRRIAVVPTMGALHEGHLTLIRRAKEQADVVIVTLFVNPTQFGRGEDFERYPRNRDRDQELAAQAGADVLFAPAAQTMYPDGYHTFVSVESITAVLEGAVRPGHFRGVATIVTKLLNCTKPHVAVFGQKDAQQAAVIRRLVSDLNFDVEIVVVPTVRESDGLAMSSRNSYLTPADRAQAPVLFRALREAERRVLEGGRDAVTIRGTMEVMIRTETSAAIDYLSIADAATLQEQTTLQSGREILISLAARFGSTRLIDNVQVVVP
jgi:pantoate--beta-alanine ligase